MSTAEILSPGPEVNQGLIDAARALAPRLAERVEEATELRHVPDESIHEMDAAGINEMALPSRFGGQQTDPLTAQRVFEELARGCTSTSFVSISYYCHAWLTALFPDDVQEEIFRSENRRGIAQLNPVNAMATRKGDDFLLAGKWHFGTGQHHAGWAALFALVDNGGETPDIAVFQVPRSAGKSQNDWRTSGMAATGSDTLVFEETLVPRRMVMFLSDLVSGNSPSTVLKEEPAYQGPFLANLLAVFAGTPIGVAEAAFDRFQSRVGSRGITYTNYQNQAEAPLTHLQIAEARMKLDQARWHAERAAAAASLPAADVDEAVAVRCRADVSWAIRLSRECIDIIHSASGASAIHLKDPLQRQVRDLHALAVHSATLNTTVAELYGRTLCGLDPGVPFM
jgi:alkylation response protein AidB-like acyl-CoA dehydrogenase